MFLLRSTSKIWSGTLWLEPSEGCAANVAEGARRQQFNLMWTQKQKDQLRDRIILALFNYEYKQIQETEGWPDPIDPREFRKEYPMPNI